MLCAAHEHDPIKTAMLRRKLQVGAGEVSQRVFCGLSRNGHEMLFEAQKTSGRQGDQEVLFRFEVLAGIVAPPGEAYYAASKHGVRGFLESLQYEVSGFGIRVHLAEPGFIRTDLAAKQAPPDLVEPEYDALRRQLAGHWKHSIESGMRASDAARRIVDIVEKPGAPFRTRMGRDAVWIPRLKMLLPNSIFFALTRRWFGIGDV